MKKYVHLTLVLFIIAALSGLILGVVNAFTAPKIEIVKQNKLENGISKIFSEVETTEVVDVKNNKNILEYYIVKDEQGQTIGYVFKVVAPKSYGDTLEMLVGVDTEGKIAGTFYLTVKETPGLGTKIDPNKSKADVTINFNKQFVGLADETAIAKADAITGATISSTSVKNGIILALKYYTENIKTE